MLEGKKYNGTKIDVWGLGISLYTMVCGELPFIIEDENDIKTLINNIINGNYSVPDFVSNECKDLIKKMLEINPDKRISLEEIKKHKWVNMFNFDYMKSPGVLLHEYFIPVDIYLIKDILGNNESKIEKLIGDLLENKHNENTIKYYLKNKVKVNKGEKSVGDLRPNSELFLNYINSDKSKKNYWENDIKKITNYYLKQISDLFNKTKEKNNDGNIELFRKKNLEKFNSYIGPLIFIHNIIDGIITKVILIKNKSSNLNNKRK
jgi:serine/threonine protein kinase